MQVKTLRDTCGFCQQPSDLAFFRVQEDRVLLLHRCFRHAAYNRYPTDDFATEGEALTNLVTRKLR